MRHTARLLSSVLLVTLLVASMQSPAGAQPDPAALARAYLEDVLLDDADIRGYRRVRADDLGAAENVLAARALRFEANPPGAPRVYAFEITALVFTSDAAAGRPIAAARQTRSYTESDGSLVTVEPAGPLTGVDEGEAWRFYRDYRGAGGEEGTGVIWRRGAVLFRLTGVGPPNYETFPETLRIGNLQNDKAATRSPFVPTLPLPEEEAIPGTPANGRHGPAALIQGGREHRPAAGLPTR